MYRVPCTSVAVMLAVVLYSLAPVLAATAAAIEGTVTIRCDPSKIGEVASVQIWPVAGGATTTVPVDSTTGAFRVAEIAEGQYELVAMGVDGDPLSPEAKRFVLTTGLNKVFLSIRPPGCEEQDADGDGVADAADSCPDTPPGTAVGTDGCPTQGGKKARKRDPIPDWQVTLMYFGVVGVVAVVLDSDSDSDDDEAPASPMQP